MLRYSAHPDGNGIAVITPPAEIDLTNAKPLQDELNAALDRGITTVVIDMSKTTFCDSAALATLREARDRASAMNASLRLVISEPGLRKIFEMAGMDDTGPVYATLDAAQSDRSVPPPSRTDGRR